MHIILLPFVLLLSVASAQNGFISPKYQATTQPGRYSGNSVWELGSSQIVAFQSTWDEYRIELWQQSLSSDSAILSSTLVYNQNAGEALPQSFYWTVQTYNLELSNSPVFFFWLRDNDSDDQQSSALFNITVDSTSSSSSSSSTILSTNIPISTTVNTTRETTSPAGTVTPTSNPSSTTTSEGGSNSLSTGATAGISVGVSLATILFLAIAALVFYRRWKRRGAGISNTRAAEDSEQNKSEPIVEVEARQTQPNVIVYNQISPAELIG
ncbi:hypothetical protein F4810DRAFT_683371 [Camillea tinctor]|nr:hypothetical protein F4810DRAFT_683371 [Camillea tinctor]